MSPLRVAILPSALREIADLPVEARRRVDARILGLADDPRPHGVKALRGARFKGLYRVRVGDYRIVYQVADAEVLVLVVKVGHRKDVYRGV